MKQTLTPIVHISKELHNKLRLFIVHQSIKGVTTSMSKEAEKAILKHLKHIPGKL
jgi:hypothetical protein